MRGNCQLIVFWGVCGSGKSTYAKIFAESSNGLYIDADQFHSIENQNKMRSGIALSDNDRWPWLFSLSQAISQQSEDHRLITVACSCLKQTYRSYLESLCRNINNISNVLWVRLYAERACLNFRLSQRLNHFMPIDLLDSQLQTLDYEGDQASMISINVSGSIEATVEMINRQLKPQLL